MLLLDSAPLSVLGLRVPDNVGTTFWLTVEIVVLLPIMLVVILFRIAKTQRPGLAALLLEVKELLPHTSYERWLWLLVSITAGICEEIVFRGFLLSYFVRLEGSLFVAILFSSILFGFAHVYQGWKGVLGTGVMGAVLAYLYVSTGSLILPIVCHIFLDARIVFLAPALLKLDWSAKE
jgi:membrane protease YdiL (CAAX protease family)